MLNWTAEVLRLASLFLAISAYVATADNLVTIQNVTIIGKQQSPQNAGISRDGGVSVLLNERVLWLFDDTTITSASGELIDFVSNSAAFGLDPSNVTILQDIGLETADGNGQGGSQNVLLGNTASQEGGWIPLQLSESAFNQKQTDGDRIAICKLHWKSGEALSDTDINRAGNKSPRSQSCSRISLGPSRESQQLHCTKRQSISTEFHIPVHHPREDRGHEIRNNRLTHRRQPLRTLGIFCRSHLIRLLRHDRRQSK
jgi:hypothetical protein